MKLTRKIITAGILNLLLASISMAQAKPLKKVILPNEKPEASVVFPDWAAPAFNFSIGPIIGARLGQTEENGVRYRTMTSEFGAGARIRGIPLLPGNPGVSAEPYIILTWGNRTAKAEGTALNQTETSGFQRSWLGAVGYVYYQFFRYTLDLGLGKIAYDKDFFIDLEAKRISNDFGILILPFLSAHYTWTSLAVREVHESKPNIEEIDQWLHGRAAFSLFDFNLDVGPGVSVTQYSGRSAPNAPFAKIATAQSTYLKALTAMHVIWKLGAHGSAKYILAGSREDAVTHTIDQLPNEGIAQNKTLAPLPEGSLEASAFAGFTNLFGGIGFGWQYYYLQEKAASNRQIRRNQGFAVSYETEF